MPEFTPDDFARLVTLFIPESVSALAFWAAQQLWDKGKKSRCEEEIANYRALVMQGVSVAAPRCSQ